MTIYYSYIAIIWHYSIDASCYCTIGVRNLRQASIPRWCILFISLLLQFTLMLDDDCISFHHEKFDTTYDGLWIKLPIELLIKTRLEVEKE